MLVQFPLRWKQRNNLVVRFGQFEKPGIFIPEILIFDIRSQAKKHCIQQPFGSISIEFHNQSSQGIMMNIVGDGSLISCAEITALSVISRCWNDMSDFASFCCHKKDFGIWQVNRKLSTEPEHFLAWKANIYTMSPNLPLKFCTLSSSLGISTYFSQTELVKNTGNLMAALKLCFGSVLISTPSSTACLVVYEKIKLSFENMGFAGALRTYFGFPSGGRILSGTPCLNYEKYGFPVPLNTSSSATDERKLLKSSSPQERQSSLRSDGQ